MPDQKSPFYPLREKAIRDAFQDMNQTMLTPWAFFNSGNPTRITNCRGRTVNYKGVAFEGSPQEVFWGGFFDPCIEDTIADQMDQSLQKCLDADWYDDGALEETAELLRNHARRFYARMAEIDQKLREAGYPDSVPQRKTDREVERADNLIDSHQFAHRARLRHLKPTWFRRNRWWIAAVIAALIGAVPGTLALLIKS